MHRTQHSMNPWKRTSSEMESRPDAMNNLEVLSKMFEFCSVRDLKNYRLVGSKLWWKESMNSWREKAVLVMKPDPKWLSSDEGAVADPIRNIQLQRWRDGRGLDQVPGVYLSELQQMYADDDDAFMLRAKPFRNIKLGGLPSVQQRLGSDSGLNWILGNFPNNVRSLTLKNQQFANLKMFLNTIFLKLPNLAELQLDNQISFVDVDEASWNVAAVAPYPEHKNLKSFIVKIHDYAPLVPSHFPWGKFLHLMPGLRTLTIQPKAGGSCYFCPMGMRIMEAVASIRREDNSKLQIKNLALMSISLKENGFTGLAINCEVDHCLPLERFTGTVKDIVHLTPFSKTLKHLSLLKTNAVAEDGKVCLSNLKTFHVDGFVPNVVTILNQLETNNLEKLIVEDKICVNPYWTQTLNWRRADITLDNPSFENVTSLEFYNSSELYFVDLKGFRSISKNMPNVLHAKMPLTREAFQELCVRWPNLLTLTVSDRFKSIDDATLTGVDPHTKEKYQAGRTQSPNITNLKHLMGFEYTGILTGHSVSFGFFQLPELQHLKVKLNLNKVSVVEMAALQKKISNLRVKYIRG